MTSLADLDWRPHPSGLGGEQAKVTYPNGYGASVLRGGMYYTSGDTYEIAVLHNGELTYSLGYLTTEEAEAALTAIEQLSADPSEASTDA